MELHYQSGGLSVWQDAGERERESACVYTCVYVSVCVFCICSKIEFLPLVPALGITCVCLCASQCVCVCVRVLDLQREHTLSQWLIYSRGSNSPTQNHPPLPLHHLTPLFLTAQTRGENLFVSEWVSESAWIKDPEYTVGIVFFFFRNRHSVIGVHLIYWRRVWLIGR